MKLQAPSHTGKTLSQMRPSARTVQIEIFVSVQMPGSQDNDALSGVFALLSDLLTNVFLLVLFEASHPPLRHCQR